MGKLVLFSDRMTLDVVSEVYELLYSDIVYMKFNFMQIVVEHKNSAIPKDITIDGFFIPGIVKQAIRTQQLPIAIK